MGLCHPQVENPSMASIIFQDNSPGITWYPSPFTIRPHLSPFGRINPGAKYKEGNLENVVPIFSSAMTEKLEAGGDGQVDNRQSSPPA